MLLCVSVCNVEYPCEGMSRHATFENFGMAFLTLFQVSTGDNWNGIMKVELTLQSLSLYMNTTHKLKTVNQLHSVTVLECRVLCINNRYCACSCLRP